MTLEQDLAAWVADRPVWQRNAVARYCRNQGLTDDDVRSIADDLIAGNRPSAEAVRAEDVPGSNPTGDPVNLETISDVVGINALIAGQRLTFGDSGLTVIYGDNASGKSGYARLIREAVTARVKGDLLGDVFSKQRSDQAATVSFTVAAKPEAWRLGEEPSKALSAVRFYDEECGEAYVTSASEINYRPSALTLLDQLSADCDRVQRELQARLDQARRQPLPIVDAKSPAGQFLARLSGSTTAQAIDDATQLGADHSQELAAALAEEARLKGSDASKEQARLARLASQWRIVLDHVELVGAVLNPDALAVLFTLKAKAEQLREAERIASSKNFDNEALASVGSDTWRELWEAARAYSEQEAYQEHEFPHVSNGAVCVLCQQPLEAAGHDRLVRFQQFMSDTTARDAEHAARELGESDRAVARHENQPQAVNSAITQLQGGGEDISEIETWLQSAVERAAQVGSWLGGQAASAPAGLNAPPMGKISARIDALTAASDQIDASTFATALDAAAIIVRDLQAASALAGSKAAVVAEVQRLKQRAVVEEAKRSADTTGITRKATDLTTAHVTSLVRDRFTRETENLRLRRVTLDPTAGRKNVTLEHRAKLLGASVSARIDDVLSEGEQTALGLAGFLTEAEFDESKSAVVFDDPVSSLDAGRRSRVAKRLTELAQTRQVIVFTHEATFVTALNKAARDQGVPVTERAILRQGDQPGKAVDQHPWSVRDTAERINDMRQDLARLRTDRASIDAEQYTRRAQELGGHLSQTWERAVNIEVINRVVDRGTNEVRPMMFRLLAAITPDDDTDFQAGYAKASEWAPRHDQAPETNFVAPEPDDLQEELDRLDTWVKRVKKYINLK